MYLLFYVIGAKYINRMPITHVYDSITDEFFFIILLLIRLKTTLLQKNILKRELNYDIPKNAYLL